ncbi:hypothetical protein ACFT7S_11315 [Streptomyces sp. NPDC057136]|uniref:hypothetical protein n=1 Tax=Streptomyces sp. NPDC057136 TaxID=3346029 RepID=UPI0036435E29
MSNQYPQQPYGQPHPGQAYAGGPAFPPPPKKGLSTGAIVGIVLGGIFGVFVLLVILGLAVGGSTDNAGNKQPAASAKPAATESSAPAKADDKPATKAPTKPKAAEKKPEPTKATEFPSGDYVVGEDIPAGTYTSAGAEKGIFEFCSITTEPTGETTMPKIKSANTNERIIITLTKADGVVTIHGCEPLKPRQ